MKQVTENLKNDIKTYGRQFNFEIKVNDVEISNDDINYIKPSFNSSLFKTIMHQIEIDSKNEIPLKSKVKTRAGIKVNEPDYEYISYNTCIVNSLKKQEDTNSYIVLAYDKMVESMIDYDLTISEKITLRDYLIQICERLGWNTNNIPATFINSDKLVDPRLHVGIGYTFRDILDEIATISCSFLLFKDEDFYLLYPEDTNQNIDNEYLDEDNVTIGEKYFINSIVFSRAEESDNIYRKDDTNIQLNGLHEYRISDNQLLSTNDRDLYIDEMFEYLKTFEFYVFDVSSKGILFLEACDRFNFVLSGNTYSTILLNNEIAFEDGLTEALYTDKPEETETEYKYADTTDKKINQTYILVDKQKQIIQSVVSQTDKQNQKIAEVTQTVNELNSKISDIADITASKESMNASVSFEKVNQSEPIRVKIYPSTENISYLYPHSNLYPSDDLYLKTRILRFTNTTTNEYFDYELPDNLLRCDDVYDEFILDYDGQSCVINKRVGYNADGTTYVLEAETTVEYRFPRIELTDGDYTVELLGYSNAYLFVRLMSQNIYTTQFATKAEVNSEISQTTEEIGLSVDKKLENYSTTTQMNAAINVKANEITSNVSKTYATKTELTTTKSEIKQTTDTISQEVEKKVDEETITGAYLILKINGDTSETKLNADKIELSANDVLNLLAGNTINLSSRNITLTSEKMIINKNGRFILYDTGQEGDTSFSVYYKNTENGVSVRPHMLEQHVSKGDSFFSYDTIESRNNSNGNHFWFSGIDDYFVFLLKYGATDVNPIYITDSISRFCDANGNTKLYLQNNGAFIQGDGLYVNGYQVTTNTSDKKLKKNIKDTTIDALETIKKIKHRQFDWKKDNVHQNIGYIAQELEEIDSNYVHKDVKFDKNGKATSEYNYQVNILPMLATTTKAMQEQQEHIENQDSLIHKLQEQIKILQNEIKILKGEQ